MDIKNRYVTLLLLLCAGLVTAVPLQAASPTISAIHIQGNALIPESTILSLLQSKVGALYNAELIAKDIQHIYDIGVFSSVEVETEESNGAYSLTFIVKERPAISRIEFEGNKKIKTERIEEILTLPSADLTEIFNQKFYPQKIKEDEEKIRELYHEDGYQNVVITSSLSPDTDAPAEKVVLKYVIEEGKKAAVRKVIFEGNEAFSDDELRKKMATRKKGFLSFIDGSGKYEETTLKTDLERVKFFYVDHGYIDVAVNDYTVEYRNGLDVFITITLEEGAVYNISRVGVKGNFVYATEELTTLLTMKPGMPFSRTTIRNDILGITALYGKKGYLTPISDNTDGKLLIDPEIDVDRANKQVALTYSIREGVPHTLARVTITGNEVTRDKVIRRELAVQEGDLLDRSALEKSQRDIFNLALFEDVKLLLNDGEDANTVDLDIEVIERQTGSFNFGGGWSSVDKFVFSGDLAYANLFGLAHQITFSATLGSTTQLFNLNYTMPRFLDSKYLVGIDAYKTDREYDAYDSASVGGGLRFGRKLFKNLFGTLKYEYKEVDISDIEEDASNIIKESEGLSTTSSATLLLRYSSINNVLLPTKGMRTIMSGEYAGGFLGAENNFYKLDVTHNMYFPLYRDFALRLKGEVGYIEEFGDSDDVPISERFFAGGADTIRGYEERSVGPKDENGDEIGGNAIALATAEVIIPVNKQLRLLAFIDAGNVVAKGDIYGTDDLFDTSKYRAGAGVGIRLNTPLGLLRLDWGYKLDHQPEDKDNDEFHFGIGALF